MQLELHIPTPCPKDMGEACADVLALLQIKGRTGVTWDDFPRGFAIRSRISDLRKEGYKITTLVETLPGACTRARYVLLSEQAN